MGAVILLALAGAAKAADITTAPIPAGGIVIHIDGDITPGDEETFSAIEPDMQISGIRLSDETSRLHPRHVAPKRG
jgi:hypothetical protein